MNKTRDKNLMIQEKNKMDLRKLEDFYVNGTVEDLIPVLNAKKEELVEKMIEYAKDNEKACKWTRDGDPVEYKTEIKPLIIQNYFFKSICPIGNKIPIYNAEKLALGYEYYMDLITEINIHIGAYPPSLVSFCKLLGITTSTLREYRNSSDIDMRNITEKIYEEIGDGNLTMSQMGVAKERSTLFRLKSQNEMTEKAQPNINITYKEVVNTDKLNSKLEKYRELIDKKG